LLPAYPTQPGVWTFIAWLISMIFMVDPFARAPRTGVAFFGDQLAD
jgi:hypothetical protein